VLDVSLLGTSGLTRVVDMVVSPGTRPRAGIATTGSKINHRTKTDARTGPALGSGLRLYLLTRMQANNRWPMCFYFSVVAVRLIMLDMAFPL